MSHQDEVPIRDRKSTTIYLCNASLRRLKIHCAVEGSYLSDVIRTLILDHIPDYESQIKEGSPSAVPTVPDGNGRVRAR